MKTLLVLSLIILGFNVHAQPTANAGPDQTIYLTQTNSVTLDGSVSSGDSYQWTDITNNVQNPLLVGTAFNGFPSNPATITSPNSATTTVTGLIQGVWYYQIAVTTGGNTNYDTCAVIVDYDVPPANGSYVAGAPFDSIASIVNRRDDTTNYVATQWSYYPKYFIFFDRSRLNDQYIDVMKRKFYATVEDGYAWSGNNYSRSEMGYGYGEGIGAPVDTNTVYLYEWKGYFPQSDSLMLPNNQYGSTSAATVIWQLHSKDGYSPPFQFMLQNSKIYFLEIDGPTNKWVANQEICPYSYLYNSTHTIRIELKEGIGNGAYIKVYLDGTLKYSRTTGTVGRTFQHDYPKFATVYDFDNVLVDASTTSTRSRGRKFSLVTESWKIFTLSNSGSTNSPPTANAGSNQTINLPTNSVSLNGSGSDADGTISSYLWTEISGPSQGTISNPNSSATNISGLVQGTYQFQLAVTDNMGATGKSTMLVTVNSSSNQSPTANAGPNQSITLPVNNVSLSGSGNDPNGTISSYLWTKISGPSSFNIVSPSSAVTNVTGLVQGSYTFQLKVTDNSGATGIDTILITVNPVVNTPPTADAGSDKIITLPTNTVSLSGSGSDAEGTVSSYLWTKISGPSTYNITSPSSAVTNVSGLVQGIYQFQLTVTDNNGASTSSNMQVTVNAAANIPPTSNAGSNETITLPVSTVALSGSGSDADGTISTYNWTKISGPSPYNISNPALPTTNVTGLVVGVYKFRLTVTDNNGASASSTMQVTVNAALNIPPTVSAGSDKTITLPANSITLYGSANDADGTVVSYNWTKISGPSAGTIANATSASTGISGLVQGVYQFEFKATDNQGAVGKDTVQVTVNPASNIPPTSDAGPDKTITLPTNTVSLSGSGSDADGTVSSYLWTKISGPSAYNIVSPASPVTDVSGLVQGVYQFQLKVTDNNGASTSSNVQITVNSANNTPPVANAGANKTIQLPVNQTSLSGSGSDADGTIASYLWTKISGPSSYNIVNASSPVTDVSGLVQGVYKFRLTVTDNNGASSSSVMQVTVNPAPNMPPTVSAGSDKTLTLPANTTTLYGSANDADGTIASYLWTKISGPSAGTIGSTTSASTSISGLVQGIYQFEFKATDNQGAVGKDTVQVTVNAVPNIPPSSDAGSDKTITLPTNTVSLSGSGSDADGTVSSYLWAKISGPSAYNIVNPASPVTDVSGLVQGVYQFRLTVTDNNGASTSSTMQVTVNAAPNIAPTANAGSDKTITLPTNTTSFSGSGSDADGTIKSYLWTKISGPSSYNIVNASSPVTDVSGLVQGVYKFRLTVTDNNGASASSTMQITVNAAPNIAPTANAGSDKTITLPTNTTSLSGSGSDADGTIKSYLWAKISGPSSYNIVNTSSPVTDVSGLVQGIYRFQLTVTDNNGASASSTVQVTVNAAPNKKPNANAGSKKSITLPTNSVTLAGSGSADGGTIVSYKWSRVSGPSAYTINSPNSATTSISGLTEGDYQFQLTVTDDKGEEGNATVEVTVNKQNVTQQVTVTTPNVAPKADAGNDTTIVLPNNTVTLKGSGTDTDGGIVGYLWSQISGPSVSTILQNNQATTQATNLIEGAYEFELKVMDNKGSVGKDTVSVTVALGRLAREDNSLKVYPNPVHDVATLEINTGKNNTNLMVNIADISGKTVYRKQLVSSLSLVKMQIDMSNLIKGTYVITVLFDGIDEKTIKVLRM